MTAYRLYILNKWDLVADSIDNDFASDVDALAQAASVLDGEYAVEVWADFRLVGRVGGDLTA